ncbi:MAG: hypothetical protein HY685_02705 [Chloroflexi bacterium]|nr:hypothetical protein [Chloroflexota bacterium]
MPSQSASSISGPSKRNPELRLPRAVLAAVIQRFLLVGLVVLFVPSAWHTPGDATVRAIALIAQPYRFNFAAWEVVHGGEAVGKSLDRTVESEPLHLLQRYFGLRAEESRARAEEERAVALSEPSEEATAAREKRLSIARERAALALQVERTLQQEVTQLLEEEGLAGSFGPWSGLFPPVQITFAALPRLLIVSPRDRIDRLQSVVLRDEIPLAEMEVMEEVVAARGLSGLVEEIGGLAATYPAIITQNTDLRGAFSVTAHEWAHHYLFLHPLGQRYAGSWEMATINETVASIVGEEVAARVEARLMGKPPPPPPAFPTPTPVGGPPSHEPLGKFNANAVLRETRLWVEELLGEGKIEEAEAYMESQRRYLVENGVYLRKLNQAYFAFHGTYGDSPASLSPVDFQLRTLRARSASLGAFLKTVAQLRSPGELEALVSEG